jgi:hypothetical protein
MKKLLAIGILFHLLAGNAFAEDAITPVFDQLDNLLIRVDSGISLNNFAESLAKMKIDYNRAVSDPSQVNNPLRDDRFKAILFALEDYAKVWKLQAVDGLRVTPTIPQSAGDANGCAVNNKRGVCLGYSIPCVKDAIFSNLKQMVEPAKSAHINGW